MTVVRPQGGSQTAVRYLLKRDAPHLRVWGNLDGAPIGSDTPGVNNATGANFRVGSTNNNGEYFDGMLDDVAIFSHALTGPEVASLANGSATPNNWAPPGPVAGGAGYAAAVMADNPVAYWRFEETAGAPTAKDEVGAGPNGTTPGTYGATGPDQGLPSVATGLGSAIEFTPPAANNATTKNIDFGAGNLPWLTNFRPPTVNKTTSVEYWIKTTQNGSDGSNNWRSPAIFADESPGDGDMYWGAIHQNGAFTFSTSDIKEIVTPASGPGEVTDGIWHHVVMVKEWDTAGPSRSTMYVDGGAGNGGQTYSANTVGGNQSYQDSDGDIFRLGLVTSGERGDVQFIGMLDEVAIYNTALSEAQATAHYQAALAPIPEPATMAVVALAVAGLGGYVKKRKKDILSRRMTIRMAKTLALMLALGMAAWPVAAGTISTDSITSHADIVKTGGTVIAAQNFGGTGAVTVNGIAHANSNAGYAPINFSGAYGDPLGLSGDLFTLIDGIAGTANANEPGNLTVGGLTSGDDYLFQAYWVVKDNHATRRMNVTFEGSDSLSNITPNPPAGGAVLISYDFTAGDDTFNGSFTGTGGDENGWICGFSLQDKAPLPPPPLPPLAHRYSFDTGASDSVGTADLTLNGGATVTGGELDLPGSSSPRTNNAQATGPALTELAGTINGASAITMETWFDQDVFVNWAKTFMAGNGTADYLDITPRRGSGGNPLGITINDSGHGETLLTDGSVAVDTEYYVATTWNTDTDTMSISVGPVGGSLTTVSGGMGGNLLSNIPITELFLGSAVGFGDNDFNGQIDEFRIWGGALTGDQIAANFAAGPNTIPGAIPEPATMAAVALAVAGLGGYVRKRRRQG